MNAPLRRQIRALYDDATIRVYQAYSDTIADTALAAGTFTSPPFKFGRMTWIKPSYLWMAYRSGWGRKDEGQRGILGIDVSREGFEWALANSCPSHRDSAIADAEWAARKQRSPVRIQWDPERDLFLHPLTQRTIQIGLGPAAVSRYIDEWIVRIQDMTPLMHHIERLVADGDLDAANPRAAGWRAGRHRPGNGRSRPPRR